MPTVSVIMSVYNINSKEILNYSINSILSQTYADFEFIICDDGSTDGTYDLLLDISKKDSRIKLIRNGKNQLAAAARNRCITISQGKYIAIMDADDYSAPERFEYLVDFLEKNPRYDFVGSKANLFDDDGVWGMRRYNDFPMKEDFLFVLPFVHASVMFRKSALDFVGGYRVSWETTRTEDYDLFMRLYAKVKIGANLNETLYFVREDNATFKRRKYRYRLNEAIVRAKGFKELGLGKVRYLYVVKPLVVGLIPQKLILKLKEKYYK